MAFLQQQALANNTRKTYSSGIRAFQHFCRQQHLHSAPASKLTICLFVTALSRRVSYSTIRSYLAAIAYQHKCRGFPNPTTSNPRLQLIIAGIRRVKAKQSTGRKVRKPILLPMLGRLCRNLPQLRLPKHDQAMLCSAMTLAFHGCLRVSEFAQVVHTRDAALRLRDISASSESVVLHLRQSKTDQFRKGSHIVVSHQQYDATCPCKAMLAYLALRQGPPSTPLFQFKDGSPLTRQSFVKLLKSLIHYSGHNADNYNSHSLRIGAATFAAQQGYSEEAIKQLGRWKSMAYRRYIRL